MSDSSSQPWAGNYNPRGASLTFTNNSGVSFVYYCCLIDFPSSYSYQGDGSPLGYNNVSKINNPGTLKYNPSVKYSAVSRDLVYYGDSYYYCIKDTSGSFDPSCWQVAGGGSFQLNFTFNDMGNGWPGGQDGDTITTWIFPLFTKDSGYNPSDGPIVQFGVTNGTNSGAIFGNPNNGRPPVVNLPLKDNPGVPTFVIFNSLTQPDINFLITCVNTGSAGGYANEFNVNASGVSSDGTSIFNAALAPNRQSHAVAAIGNLIITPPMGSSFGITIGSDTNTVYPVPDPLSSAAVYIQL